MANNQASALPQRPRSVQFDVLSVPDTPPQIPVSNVGTAQGVPQMGTNQPNRQQRQPAHFDPNQIGQPPNNPLGNPQLAHPVPAQAGSLAGAQGGNQDRQPAGAGAQANFNETLPDPSFFENVQASRQILIGLTSQIASQGVSSCINQIPLTHLTAKGINLRIRQPLLN